LSARLAGRVFFPLDERLGLLGTGYSPVLVEAMVRLGTRLPFAVVAEEMALLFGVSVSPDTVRRLTEDAGTHLVAIEQQELEHLEQRAPEDPPGPAVQQVSADGVMVSLTDGRWTEVRTIALGTVEQQDDAVCVQDLTYFSRHGTADQFIRQATLPTYERGTRRAPTVAAVMDGARWLQELINEHCPHAVRILDFPHAVGYLHQAAHAALGLESQEAEQWLDRWVRHFKTGDPEAVLAALRALPAPTPEAATAKRTAIRYLGSRRDQIRYAAFREQGLPIGSGIVESAGKLVVEARLKGSGMHWAPRHLNPLLALRGRLCSGQWCQTWLLIQRRWRRQIRERQRQHRRDRQAQCRVVPSTPTAQVPPRPPTPKLIVDGRPTADHPWKRVRAIPAA